MLQAEQVKAQAAEAKLAECKNPEDERRLAEEVEEALVLFFTRLHCILRLEGLHHRNSEIKADMDFWEGKVRFENDVPCWNTNQLTFSFSFALAGATATQDQATCFNDSEGRRNCPGS